MSYGGASDDDGSFSKSKPLLRSARRPPSLSVITELNRSGRRDHPLSLLVVSCFGVLILAAFAVFATISHERSSGLDPSSRKMLSIVRGDICADAVALRAARSRTLRAVVLGHSVAAPGGHPKYPELLRETLGPRWPVEVSNYAVFGSQTDDCVNTVIPRPAVQDALARADVVFVDFSKATSNHSKCIGCREMWARRATRSAVAAEQLILRLRALPQRPAIVFLVWWHGGWVWDCGGTPKDALEFAATSFHNVSTLSYQQTACAMNPREKHLGWIVSGGQIEMHPDESTHRQIAQLLGRFLVDRAAHPACAPGARQQRTLAPAASLGAACAAGAEPYMTFGFGANETFPAAASGAWRVYADDKIASKPGWILDATEAPAQGDAATLRIGFKAPLNGTLIVVGRLRSYGDEWGSARVWVDGDEDRAVVVDGRWDEPFSQTQHEVLSFGDLCGSDCRHVASNATLEMKRLNRTAARSVGKRAKKRGTNVTPHVAHVVATWYRRRKLAGSPEHTLSIQRTRPATKFKLLHLTVCDGRSAAESKAEFDEWAKEIL